MTRRLQAFVAAAFVAALTGTPSDARHQNKHNNNTPPPAIDPHSIGAPVYGSHERRRRTSRQARSNRGPVKAVGVSRDCLHHSARDLLSNLEARFGKVELVSTCRPGARMPSGDVSWHARNRAFDFKVGRGVDRRDVMVWLGRNSPGVTMSYRSMPHIHTDTGNFHKVIYNAASHEAGERAVALWQERERLAALETAPWTATAAYVEPDFEIAIQPPVDRAPAPITWGDRVGIFQRYFESQDVVVRPWVTLSGVDRRLVRMVNDAAAHFGRTAYINSGYRTREHNRRVGGARNSEHLKGLAVDFRVAGVSPRELRGYIVANIKRWGIRGLGTYGTHTHADVGHLKATRLVEWNGHRKRYAKRRHHHRYAAAG